MKPCFGYIRVSTQKQGLGVSLEAQKEAITVFASQHNLTVAKWFEEKETAAKSGRPIFSQMLRQLKKGKAQGLIMHKIDRSARNLRDWALVSELPNLGIDIFFATESLDFRSRGGRLAANLQAVIAEDYIHNLREETIKGLKGRLKQGLYPFRAPIGYLDNGRGQPKTPCPKKAPLIREAFSLYATGQYSLRSLTAELERIGLRNNAEKPLSLHGVESVLANPFYTGLISIKKTGALYQGVHEPIISTSMFQRVQDVKAGKAGKKVTRHNHLFRGLFRCGLCDGPMSPERQKGHVYYRCQNPTCPTTTVREDRLNDAILAAFHRVRMSEEDASRLEAEWRKWTAQGDKGQHVRSIELRIAETEARLIRLTDLLVDGVITAEEHQTRRRTLSLELSALKEELEHTEKLQLSEAEMQKFLELMKNLAELHISANEHEKRWMVENCFSNRTVIGKEPFLEPNSWLQCREISELSPLVTQNDTLLELFKTGKIPAKPEEANTGVPEPLIEKPTNRNYPTKSMPDDEDGWFWTEAA
ncbi:recombinase family protein [Roseovarius sp. A46]|uniref:recombinase family protein n=1 Tax=Roseovarius sp. A46 TaxID=2109331 RepID=UPI001012C107|nr:recombinase family protein [Roseovarius sp. A46]RXV64724.1 recombinase family protein [Roseovarius sp. A46]